MKYVIEILALNGAGQPRVLHSFSHTASSVHMVCETMKAVQESHEWPAEAHGFRILSEAGDELYRLARPSPTLKSFTGAGTSLFFGVLAARVAVSCLFW